MYQSKYVCCNEFLICTIERALHSTYYDDDDDDNSADMHEYNFLFARKSEIYIHLGQTDQTQTSTNRLLQRFSVLNYFVFKCEKKNNFQI